MFKSRVLSEFGVVITVIVVIVTSGKCARHDHGNWCDPSHNRPCHGHRPNQGENNNQCGRVPGQLCIEIKPEYIKGERSPIQFVNNSEYNFDVHQHISLRCIFQNTTQKGKMVTLQWSDTNGFHTEPSPQFDGHTLELNITPDILDDNLTLTCTAAEQEMESKSLVISLKNNNRLNHRQLVPKYQLLPIKRDSYFMAPCTGLVYRPNGEINVVKIANTLVDNFNIKNNGTILSCITYEDLKFNFTGGRKIKTYERRKTTYLLYLDSEKEVTTEWEVKTVTTALEFPTENNVATVSETGSQSSQTALVGGILGAVIFILISILIATWYRNKRRQLVANVQMADQVVYAEIEERPPTVPPPRRCGEPPYAVIAGTLVPKQSREENLYNEIK